MNFVLRFTDIGMQHVALVGGKNASLGEMINQLSQQSVQVPNGFATTTDAYRDFLQRNHLDTKIEIYLAQLNIENMEQLQKTSAAIRDLICNAKLSEEFTHAVRKAYRELNLDSQHSVAVRSSATAEDLPNASFAGQQETFLNVKGEENVLAAIKNVYASLFTERAIAYRVHQNFNHQQVAISVGVQKMIRSDLGASGVIFTLDTESGFDQVVFLTASYGLGETVVQGLVNPDEFYVHKPTLAQGKESILSRKLGSKALKMIYSNNKECVKTVDVAQTDRQRFCLNDREILILAQQAMTIEKHYGKPMDIEWAKDGVDGQLYIVQARPETVKARDQHQVIEQYQLHEKTTPIVTGRSIGQKIGQGVARIIDSPKHMDKLKPGEILVTDITDPDWEPIMKRASAIVTNRGGRTCHAAIIARELGIPALVGCIDATQKIKDGAEVTVSCAEGESGFVYPGLLKFSVEKTAINNLPELPVKLCINLANPEQAFATQFLPNHGVGLARLEFIIGNNIGMHPNALLNLDKLKPDTRREIMAKTAAYESPTEFYIEKLAEGIATIAAAFYPRPIIVRFSDFKSNEYANLLGGAEFEPHEENPMIGYRGASRYLTGNFRDCFKLECEAMLRVREKKGLTNAHVMYPFVRTVAELKSLNELIAANGLPRHQNGLQVYMMCEIPSNALLADQFLEHVDGFSIGSNDLTQLTLGLDRDSQLVADLFDERNDAVKAVLHRAIQACRRANKYVGICGQGPSDHADFAQWLMEEGIESMSLTPDSVVRTWIALAQVESSDAMNQTDQLRHVATMEQNRVINAIRKKLRKFSLRRQALQEISRSKEVI